MLLQTPFNTNGTLKIVVGDLLKTQCDVVANSVGPKEKANSKFIPKGMLEHQFADKGGAGLIKELEGTKHGCWGFGDIIFTASYSLNKGEGSPKEICHFCVPRTYQGSYTLLVSQ